MGKSLDERQNRPNIMKKYYGAICDYHVCRGLYLIFLFSVVKEIRSNIIKNTNTNDKEKPLLTL